MADRALFIEDDLELCRLLVPELEGLGLAIDCAHDGQTGLRMATSGGYAVVILDIMLPQLEGVEVCRRLRAHDVGIPILILSSKADELNKVLLLELGADDYLTKPFSVSELKARIKALLRRQQQFIDSTAREPQTVVCGDLVIHLDACSADLAGAPLSFTSGEFQIVALLASQLGRVFSRDDIIKAIHGVPLRGYDAAITTHISRIRAKLESDPADPRYLQTVQGMGYRLVDPSAKRSVT